MQYRHAALVLATLALVVTACDDDNDDDVVNPPQNAQVQFVNASTTTTGSVDIANGTTTLGSLATGTASASCQLVPAGSQSGITFKSGTTTVATLAPFTFEANKRYTVVLFGPNTATVFIDNFPDTPAAGQNALRVINATGTAGDVFIAAPNATLTTPTFSNITANGITTNFQTLNTTATSVSLFNVGTTTGTPRASFTLASDIGGNRIGTVVLTNAFGTPAATGFLVSPCTTQ
jgi:uncharacterized protein DUF4397